MVNPCCRPLLKHVPTHSAPLSPSLSPPPLSPSPLSPPADVAQSGGPSDEGGGETEPGLQEKLRALAAIPQNKICADCHAKGRHLLPSHIARSQANSGAEQSCQLSLAEDPLRDASARAHRASLVRSHVGFMEHWRLHLSSLRWYPSEPGRAHLQGALECTVLGNASGLPAPLLFFLCIALHPCSLPSTLP